MGLLFIVVAFILLALQANLVFWIIREERGRWRGLGLGRLLLLCGLFIGCVVVFA